APARRKQGRRYRRIMERAGLVSMPREFFPLLGDPSEARRVANQFNCNIEGRISHMFELGCSTFW
ncbi:MAG: hypothetical protein ACJ8G5_02445, partial [Burkholderiales bacterium]